MAVILEHRGSVARRFPKCRYFAQLDTRVRGRLCNEGAFLGGVTEEAF